MRGSASAAATRPLTCGVALCRRRSTARVTRSRSVRGGTPRSRHRRPLGRPRPPPRPPPGLGGLRASSGPARFRSPRSIPCSPGPRRRPRRRARSRLRQRVFDERAAPPGGQHRHLDLAHQLIGAQDRRHRTAKERRQPQRRAHHGPSAGERPPAGPRAPGAPPLGQRRRSTAIVRAADCRVPDIRPHRPAAAAGGDQPGALERGLPGQRADPRRAADRRSRPYPGDRGRSAGRAGQGKSEHRDGLRPPASGLVSSASSAGAPCASARSRSLVGEGRSFHRPRTRHARAPPGHEAAERVPPRSSTGPGTLGSVEGLGGFGLGGRPGQHVRSRAANSPRTPPPRPP